MKKTGKNYSYEVKTKMPIHASSPKGLFVSLKNISLTLESNFPLTNQELEDLGKAIFLEIKKQPDTPSQVSELKKTKSPLLGKSTRPITREIE